MNITSDKFTSLLSSGKCVMILSEEPGFKIPKSNDSDEDYSSGIRLESVGTVALSETKLVLVIQENHVVGAAMLSADQYEYLGQEWSKSFDSFLFNKWQDEKYGG